MSTKNPLNNNDLLVYHVADRLQQNTPDSAVIQEIQKRKKIPILVGGTGLYFNSLVNGLVKIPNIPIKFRNKIRMLQKTYGQKKFYKKLIKLDPKVKSKFDPMDTQRSIRAFEIKTYTKISMHDWFNKTKPFFNESVFLKF